MTTLSSRLRLCITGLLAALSLLAAPDLQQLQSLYHQPPTLPADGFHLTGTLEESFHPGVKVTLQTELWSYRGKVRELQRLHHHIAHFRNWDGKQLLAGEGRRIRYLLATDQLDIQRGFEVWSLLNRQAEPAAFTWEAAASQQVQGETCRQLRATSRSSGTTYRLFLQPVSGHLRAIAYEIQPLYGGIPQPTIVEYLFTYPATDTPPYPTRIEVARNGETQQSWHLEELQAWHPKQDDFFSRQALTEMLSRYPPLPALDTDANRQRKASLLTSIEILLGHYDELRISDVVALGDLSLYQQALKDPQVTLLVAPERVGAHSTGHYMPMDVDPDGHPRQDVITMRALPDDSVQDAMGSLHEASHLLIRRHQAHEPILAPDDEDLVAFQEEMIHLLDSARVFESVAFGEQAGNWEQQVQRRWGHIVFRYRYGIADHQLTPEQLAQFHRMTGFQIDLAAIREHYLAAGIPAALLPVTLNERFEGILAEVKQKQKQLRR